MTRNSLGFLLVGCVIFLMTAPLVAHHSFDAEFDRTKPIKFEGKIAKVDWMNPHIYVHVDVTGSDGKVTRWACIGGAPNALFRQGLRKEAIIVGETVKVDGYLAKKSDLHYVNGSVTYLDGRSIFRAATGGGAPGNPTNQ